ncbi:MAG: hypothetical protein DMG75_00550 [Acidobacteria bacterium]|nr:MAG: hypothetical protein DMG75_00550 [Acidobacteriota bacterium]
MAAARQKEIKLNITVVATKTLTAGRFGLWTNVDIFRSRRQRRLDFEIGANLQKIAYGKRDMLGQHE